MPLKSRMGYLKAEVYDRTPKFRLTKIKINLRFQPNRVQAYSHNSKVQAARLLITF